jgi:hypothetical protein
MWSLGCDDWIKYGWGRKLSKEWSRSDALCFSINKPNHNTTAIDAGINAVRKITETYRGPYFLMCSGGVDSQAMIWAWLLSGVPFEVISIQYWSDNIFFNDYDLECLDEFSAAHKFRINYKTFDLIPFLENELTEVALNNDCDSPQINTYIKMTDLVDNGTILFSGNILSSVNSPPVNYTLLGLHRFALRLPPTRQIIPFFFLHDPILATSFTPVDKAPMSYIYQNSGYPVIPQPAKFNGFEKIKKYYDKYITRVLPLDRLKFSSKASSRAFDLLFRYPFEGTGKCKANCPIQIL